MSSICANLARVRVTTPVEAVLGRVLLVVVHVADAKARVK